MVSEHVVADVLTQLLEDCQGLVSAQAVAVMVVDRSDVLSLLSSTSHRATELELLQIQASGGPCVDAIRSGQHISAASADEIVRRWGGVGRAIVGVGYEQVDSYPMRWRGRTLGGLNIFRTSPTDLDGETETLAQAFADVATLVVVQSSEIPADQVAARVHEAIMARAQVEQAKGVLAHVHGLDMPEAYDHLRRLASDNGRSLTETALYVVREQHEGNRS